VDDLPIIKLRQVEANVIKPVYEEMVRELGEEKAREILGKAIERDAIAQGSRLAASLDGPADLAGFASLLPNWQKEDALQIEVIGQTEGTFDFNVKRCRYSEMYRDMGLGGIGDLLSCNRDGAFCVGFNPDIEMTRTQTIMQGANHCDFRFKDKSKT
jgi:hypothetical protein